MMMVAIAIIMPATSEMVARVIDVGGGAGWSWPASWSGKSAAYARLIGDQALALLTGRTLVAGASFKYNN